MQLPSSLRLEPLRLASGRRVNVAVGDTLPDTTVTLHNANGQRMVKVFMLVTGAPWSVASDSPSTSRSLGLLTAVSPACSHRATALLPCSLLLVAALLQGQKHSLRVQQRLVYVGPRRPSAYVAELGCAGAGEPGNQTQVGAHPYSYLLAPSAYGRVQTLRRASCLGPMSLPSCIPG